MRKLKWIGFSLSDLKALPPIVKNKIGFALYQLQTAIFPLHTKPLKGLSGVFEIVCDVDKNTYRSIYATKLGEEIYVLKKGLKRPNRN